MLTAGVVTVVVDGAILPSFAPARIVGGRVLAPLSPIVVRLASRTVYGPGGATVEVERGGFRIVVPVIFVENDVPYVELARVVRGIGGSAVFDSPTKTLAIDFATDGGVETPAPFDPQSPRVAPTDVFTPTPRPEPSRGTDPGVPRPRRTAIPAVPSQPVVASPAGSPTDQRR